MSRSFTRALMQYPAPAALMLNDHAGTILNTNPLMTSKYGLSPNNLPSIKHAILNGWMDLVQMPVDNETWADHCDPVYSSDANLTTVDGTSHQVRIMATRLDHSHCFFSIHPRTTHSPATNPIDLKDIELAQVAYDITEHIPVGTYTMVLSPNQPFAKFTFVSTRFLDIIGLDRQTVMQDPIKAFSCGHPDDLERWIALNQQAFIDKTPFQAEARIIRNGEIRWIKAESNCRKRSDGSYAWEGVMMDITEKKEAEASLQKAHEQLLQQAIQTARLEERQSLLEDLHDGFASQLAIAQHQLKQGKISTDHILAVLKQCQEDLHLIAHAMQTTEDNLSSSIADWRHRLMSNHRERSPTFHWSTDLATCPHLEPFVVLQILRILQEALANAIKHAQASKVMISAIHKDGQVVLSVEDDGCGLTDGVRSSGQGIANMKKRGELIKAKLIWHETKPGTKVTLMVPSQGCSTHSD